jgi:hypothetical protein
LNVPSRKRFKERERFIVREIKGGGILGRKKE